MFLPIAERELKVASRKKATYGWRLVGALFFLILSIYIILVTSSTRSASSLGIILHTILSWTIFVLCSMAGVFFTADCLSEERANGTLGLLFLADLRGYDVVLGKLMASSVQAFYATVAAFPILAVPLLMGGLTGTAFWKSGLAILNALWFSLCVGMLISSLHGDSRSAMRDTWIALIILIGLPPVLDIWVFGRGVVFAPILSYFSPSWPMVEASRPFFRTEYWTALALSHALAWGFLVKASLLIPWTWREGTKSEKKIKREIRKMRPMESRPSFRRVWLRRNPIAWILLRDRRYRRASNVVLIGGLMFLPFSQLMSPPDAYRFHIVSVLAIQIWVAIKAARFFYESRKTGALELILCTPLREREIVHGQLWAIVRLFWFPFFLLIVMNLAVGINLWNSTAPFIPFSSKPKDVRLLELIALNITSIMSTLALIWVGMWEGLKSPKSATGALKTFALVIILPPCVNLELVHLLNAGMFLQAGKNYYLISLALSFCSSLAFSLSFIRWSHHRLFTQLRAVASGTFGSSFKNTPHAMPGSLPKHS